MNLGISFSIPTTLIRVSGSVAEASAVAGARYGHDVQVLSSFSDLELADIGINRCDIDRARGQSR